MDNFIKGFPAGLQTVVWSSSVRAEGLTAGLASIPAPAAVLGLHESVADDITSVWFPMEVTIGVATTPILAYLAHLVALVRVFIAKLGHILYHINNLHGGP
jgi:hypothetical protein